MTHSDASRLRHDLRTPLNHIVGYTELLMEESEEEFPWTQVIQEVSELGKGLLKTIEVSLPSAEPHIPEQRLAELRQKLKAPVEHISEVLKSIKLPESAPQHADIERLAQATERLAHFVQTGSLEKKAVPASGRPAATPVERSALGHLLVVDDDPGNRDVLARMLRRLNYQVSVAVDGDEALNLIRKNQYDLVLLDIILPRMDGYQVLREIKNSSMDLPVIVISALGEMDSIVRCIEMGAEDYFTKPFEAVLLRARIASALDRKKFRDRLISQQRLASLGELTAGVAHEIKNPLNFVLNFADLADETTREIQATISDNAAKTLLDDVSQDLAKIKEHARRADQIVKGMLLHARSSSEDFESVDVNQLVSQYVNLAFQGCANQHNGSGICLQTRFDPGVGTIRCQPADLGRVFINLITNACYAVQEKEKSQPGFSPSIVVETRRSGEAVQISVRDNGMGVPSAIRDKIFNPFFTTRPANSGVGLGLSISHEITVRHKGQLLLKTVEGKFSEFVVQLPGR